MGEDKTGKKKATPAGKHVTSQYCNFFIWASKNSSTFIFTPLPSYPSGEGEKKAAEHSPETKTQDMDIKKNKIPPMPPADQDLSKFSSSPSWWFFCFIFPLPFLFTDTLHGDVSSKRLKPMVNGKPILHDVFISRGNLVR